MNDLGFLNQAKKRDGYIKISLSKTVIVNGFMIIRADDGTQVINKDQFTRYTYKNKLCL